MEKVSGGVLDKKKVQKGNIIPIHQISMPPLAPSSLNVMRAPEMTSIFGIWELELLPKILIWIKSS